ncbi:MAG TPA: hypothetical protein VHP63_03125 [candidate division Zixibacteria bacterium]|nr:hypothetical protein [candidate division Zixibacteria bacterium]
MKVRNKLYALVTFVVTVLITVAVADVPRVISYQGRLKNTAGVPYDGAKFTAFKIYDGTGIEIWNSGVIAVNYDSGLCSVKLGELPQPALPTSNWTSDTGLTLGITVDVDPEISPRTKFTTVGYAMHAKDAENADFFDGLNSTDFAMLSEVNYFTASENVFEDGSLSFRRANFHRWRLREQSTAGLQVFQVYDDGNALRNLVRFEWLDNGNVNVVNTLSKGGGAFRIDHPLDPENKILQHSFVESPDMMNVYNGIVVLDANGEATIEMPNYFEALNRDFRYQLTCLGEFAPVFVKSKISGNKFSISGGKPGMEVSWQVTGIRHDKWADANRIQVEIDKDSRESGKYIHPEAFGLSTEKAIGYEAPKD